MKTIKLVGIPYAYTKNQTVTTVRKNGIIGAEIISDPENPTASRFYIYIEGIGAKEVDAGTYRECLQVLNANT